MVFRMANIIQHKYILIFAVVLFIQFICNSCQLPDAPLENDYDYLHFVTDATVQGNKLFLGIKNERDKIIASIDLQLLLNSTDKNSLNINIVDRFKYNNPDPDFSYDFITNHFRNRFDYSKYKNELPSFVSDLSTGSKNLLIPNNFIYNIVNKSKFLLNQNYFFNSTLHNNILFSTVFFKDNIYFNYEYDTTINKKYDNGYDHAFVSYDINLGKIDTLLSNEFLKEGNEYIRNSFALNDSIYVFKNNSFINVHSKSEIKLNELNNDYVIETFQENKNRLIFSTLKSKVISLNSINNYNVIDCLPTIQKFAEINHKYGITEIYLKNEVMYFIAYYIDQNIQHIGNFDKIILFSYNFSDNQFSKLFDIASKDFIKKYNMLSYTNEESVKYKQSNLWSIAVDDQENVYLGCNGLFIIDKNGNLLNYFNSFDLARMCK